MQNNSAKKKFYKVVKNHSPSQEVYKSARCGGTVHYPLGKWTSTKNNTRLFVFDNLSSAKDFCISKDGEMIFECEIKGGIRLQGAMETYQNVEFWQIVNKVLAKKKSNYRSALKKAGIVLADYPAILAKSVKLIKRVD